MLFLDRLRQTVRGANMESIIPDSRCLTYITPFSTRVVGLLFAFVMLLGAIVLPVVLAFVIYQLAVQCGSPVVVAWIPAVVTYVMSIRVAWQLVTAPIRFRIDLEPMAVSIGGGLLRRSYAYDEVEAISLPENNHEHGIALEGGERGAFVHLNTADEARCAELLRSKCKNAIFVDRSGQEHLPSNPDQPLMTLGALYRRNRWLVFGSIVPTVFLGTICLVQSLIILRVMFGFEHLPIGDVVAMSARLCAELVGLVCLVRFGSQRMNMTRVIRNKMEELWRSNAEE